MKKLIKEMLSVNMFRKLSYFKQNLVFVMIIFIDIVKFLLGKKKIVKPTGLKKILPKTIQFPITHRCNLKCKTCNVYNNIGKQITVEQVRRMVKDNFFSEISSVGINGGEPFILSNIEDYISAILELPRIKNINIISNGILRKIILEKMKIIYSMCKNKEVKVGFTTSLDGYKDIHDSIRGVNGAFEKTIQTYQEIKKSNMKYCDSLGIICTISRFNIFSINDLIAYFDLNGMKNVTYQLAVEHNRLNNQNITSFSVMDDNYTRMLAQEFFYSLFIQTSNRKYFYIYSYLKNNGKDKRKSPCKYMDRDVTVDGNGNLAYCATVSKAIGHVDNNDYASVFFNESNLKYRNSIINQNCDSCIHYTTNNGYLLSNIKANKILKDSKTWNYKYYNFFS